MDDEEMDEPRGHCYQCGRTYAGSEADHLTNLSHIVSTFFLSPIYGFEILY